MKEKEKRKKKNIIQNKFIVELSPLFSPCKFFFLTQSVFTANEICSCENCKGKACKILSLLYSRIKTTLRYDNFPLTYDMIQNHQ